MAELERAKRRRVAARAWASCSRKKLSSVLEESDVDKDRLHAVFSEVKSRLDELDNIQLELEVLIEDEDEMLDDINKAGIFRDEVIEVLEKAGKVMKLSQSRERDVLSSVSGPQLPRLDLPTFDGDILSWLPFWERFEEAVGDRKDLPDIIKFEYLQSCLKGEAARCVVGLALTSANFQVACDLLSKRFGKTEVIIFSHVQQLLAITSPLTSTSQSLRSLIDSILVHIRSLSALEITGDKYGIFLVPMILSKLNAELRMEWARLGPGKEADLDALMNFLTSEVERRERSGAVSKLGAVQSPKDTRAGRSQLLRTTRTAGRSQLSRDSTRQMRTPSGAALTASSGGCIFCGKPHRSVECPELLKLSVSQKHDLIKRSGACFRCLSVSHRARECQLMCELCGGGHHKLCCFGKVKGNQGREVENPGMSGFSPGKSDTRASLSCNSGDSQCVVLPTARVMVHGVQGSVPATLLFDTGSDRSYVAETLVKKVGATWLRSESVSYAAFGGGKSTCERAVRGLSVSGANLSKPVECSLSDVEVPVICSPLQRPRVPRAALQTFAGIELADTYHENRDMTVDILVGLDLYWGLVQQGFVRCSEGSLVAQETFFGWIVSGVISVPGTAGSTTCQLLTLGDLHEDAVRNLWSLEGIGIRSDEELASSKVLEDFESSIRFTDGRYEVPLPWKQGEHVGEYAVELKSNLPAAESRLQSLSCKLDRDPDLRSRYNAVLSEMEESGVIEEVPSEEFVTSHPTFYLPHHPVVKESSETTKVRPVFDASACGPNGVSLNDCLEVGPCLMPNLVDVMLRFRRWRYAVTADIIKAFLQISLRKEDRDVQRFLWLCDGRERVMRVTRVTFGTCSSPFLLNATLRHHLSRYGASRAVTEMQSNFYVDDFLSGADSEEEARSLLSEAQSVMADAGMCLAKCKSNSPLLFDNAVSGQNEVQSVKVLGLRWIPKDDVFMFDGVSIPDDVVPTKRVVLSFIARLFDPLGFLTPYTMVAKCLFQRLWQQGLQWDEVLPEECCSIFTRWLQGLETLKRFRVPRSYSVEGWSGIETSVELHAFGDASPSGYGAAVYLRFPLSDGSQGVSLVMAKGRVAPVKKVSLPRLELLGSLLAARLVTHVRRALCLPDSTVCKCWTDSMVALGWIRGDPRRWKQFVSNRVIEIHSLTSPADWSFVPGEDNPSDLTTRGVTADQLLESELWLEGPAWLSEPAGQPPRQVEMEASRTPPEESVLMSTLAADRAGAVSAGGGRPGGDVPRPCSGGGGASLPCSGGVARPCSDGGARPSSDGDCGSRPCCDGVIRPCSGGVARLCSDGDGASQPCSDGAARPSSGGADGASGNGTAQPSSGALSPGSDIRQSDYIVCEMMKESEEVEHVSLLAFQPECVFPTERWGKLSKAVRVVAWVRRFIENCRCPQEKRIDSELSFTELANARNELLRQEQRRVFHEEWTALKRGKKVSKSSAIFRLAPFVDDDRLLRVGSRLEMSELQYEEKYPVLVPRGHLAELLVREQHLLLCHAGVNTMVATLRAAYFILGLRCTAKRVKRACVSCQRFDSKPCNEEAAPLPGCRVSEAPPFSVTGVDFAGPIFCIDFPRKKFYVCLFTCAVTRAVHHEMTEALSLEEFMMVLRRFSARRGVPRIIYSDNAPTFKGADTQLQRLFGHLAPEWRFNVPPSPWWGGFFERLIKSIKLGLRKSLGTRCLKRTELETVLFEVECCVNSRPLTFVGMGAKELF